MLDVAEKLVELLNEVQTDGLSTNPDRHFIWNREVAGHLLLNYVTIQKWTSVDESLPEKEGFYLAHRKDDGWPHIEVIWYGSGCLWNYIWTHEVTHWMPLPAPPKEEV